MSYSNGIRKLLDIQDPNISFQADCISDGECRGQPCHYVKGVLTYTPKCCEKCGVLNKDHMIYKNGTKMSRITLPINGVKKTYLLLNKQRFKCKACGKSVIAKTPIVEKHSYISVYTKAQVVIKATEAQSLQTIARDCAVSPSTVQRIIKKEAKPYMSYFCKLPKHLSFDEFKYAKGRMAFEYINAETGDILDILPHRDSRTIKNHFIAHYNLVDRKNVKTITIDMNAGYVNVIKDVFPQAKVIIDRFHLTQLISRAMNQSRVRIMNGFNTSNGEDMKKYRRLKRYWKLILKRKSDLSSTAYKYYSLFGQRLGTSVVNDMLNYDAKLKANYDLYQSLLSALSNRDFEELELCLQKRSSSLISSYMKTSLKTLRKHLPYIKNSFIYPFNNGRIEGINNKIKVLNRVAYGYRNFYHYKARIMLHFKLKPITPNHIKTRQSKIHAQVA